MENNLFPPFIFEMKCAFNYCISLSFSTSSTDFAFFYLTVILSFRGLLWFGRGRGGVTETFLPVLHSDNSVKMYFQWF